MRHLAVLIITGVILFAATASAQPQPPAVDHLRIKVEPQPTERMPVMSLAFEPRDVSADITSFELAITDELGTQTIVISSGTTYLRRPDLRVMHQRVRVEVRAIDSHGTRSLPTVVELDVDQQYRCGLGPMIMFVMRVFAAFMFVAIALVIMGMRRSRRQAGSIEGVSLLVADSIVRAVLRRSGSAAVAAAGGFLGALTLDHGVLAALLAVVAFVPLGNVIAARRVARQLARERASAELRGTLLIVRSPAGQAHLAASPRVVASARTAALPASIVR